MMRVPDMRLILKLPSIVLLGLPVHLLAAPLQMASSSDLPTYIKNLKDPQWTVRDKAAPAPLHEVTLALGLQSKLSEKAVFTRAANA